MRPLRLILALAAAAYVASQFWQERRRLSQIKRLSGRAALAHNEILRKRAERNITLFAGVICAIAAATAVYAFGFLPAPSTPGGP